jgi:hypothetical protein
LPIAMMALNNRVTQSTGMSTFFMTHGFHQSLMDFTIPVTGHELDSCVDRF